MELILDVIFLIGAIAGLLGATWSLRAQYRANRALFYRMCAAAGGYFAYFAFGVLGLWGFAYFVIPETSQAADNSSIQGLLILLILFLWVIEGVIILNRTFSHQPPPWLGTRFNWLDGAALSAATGCVALAR
jgi:hypothetical protein